MEFKSRKQNIRNWCIENDFTELLDRWDYEKNEKSPEDVYNLSGSYWIKCKDHPEHSSLHYLDNIVKRKKIPECSICNSFGVWCEEHSREDLLRRWDYEKNKVTPYEIAKGSFKKYWFKCPKGIHESDLKPINNIVKQYGTSLCEGCNSFGQWGIDNICSDFIEKYWSDKNTVNPFRIARRSNKKIWIKCQEKKYHPDYQVSCANFAKGTRCPYCRGLKVAKEDSLGYLYPKSLECWVEKKTTPFDYTPNSNKKVYWNCEKHGQYKRSIIGQVEADFVCPQCRKHMTESKLERKVSEYIERLYRDIKHEYDCTIIPVNPETGRKLPFDNEIVPLKLII